ncbi:MAG: hypothetical protein HN353_12020 [Bdellovibrionales bacterium]|nr:hypothetical protein [Bdellovibrionales bacterium]MBT3526178.1 hypothetical protein [Bdellovibrionales bacterium]MBT7669732.1 hypothetical protein [Bdellovibrionales bacterium]MBT7766441.1 hypothetical protein [Bdellovibrionales bacterium]
MFSTNMLSIVLLVILTISAANSSEIDSFTTKNVQLASSLDVINHETNRYFDQAVDLANKSGARCDEQKLYKEMRVNFRNHIGSELIHFILESDKVERVRPPLNQTIYKDFSIWQSLILGAYYQILKIDSSGALVQMGDHRIGSDKFEHFFGSGFRYFKKHYFKGHSVKRVLRFGIWLERYILGATTTGVFAYADLVANFTGMRFWNHVLQLRDDPYGKDFNYGPYVVCQDDRWVKVKTFNWASYIDDGWDEGINCSRFRTRNMTDKVLRVLEDFSIETGEKVSCPLNSDKLDAVNAKYGQYSHWLINMDGFAPLRRIK